MADLRFTEAERLAHIGARKQTILRAIRLIDSTDAARLAVMLRNAEIKPGLQEDTGKLRALLAASLEGVTFGAWKASQRICKAAGLRY